MTGLESFEQLTLSKCKELENFPKILGMTSLKVLQWDHTLLEEFPPFSSLSGLYGLSFDCCSRVEEFPDDLSGLKHIKWFHAYYTAITKLPSPSLLLKKSKRYRF
ncbi:hypothetical protein CJ030_MR7G011807 [Morella rubra]|nr:hypothetical protein CJ030_MR7G011807 [Morella rubra]